MYHQLDPQHSPVDDVGLETGVGFVTLYSSFLDESGLVWGQLVWGRLVWGRLVQERPVWEQLVGYQCWTKKDWWLACFGTACSFSYPWKVEQEGLLNKMRYLK